MIRTKILHLRPHGGQITLRHEVFQIVRPQNLLGRKNDASAGWDKLDPSRNAFQNAVAKSTPQETIFRQPVGRYDVFHARPVIRLKSQLLAKERLTGFVEYF